MILFSIIASIAFGAGCSDYTDCKQCIQSTSYECQYDLYYSACQDYGYTGANDPKTDYSYCPSTSGCGAYTDCVSCLQSTSYTCTWSTSRRSLAEVDSSYAATGTCAETESRRALASYTDYNNCPTTTTTTTAEPEELVSRWWFVTFLVIIIAFVVWLGVGFLIYGAEVDKHEESFGVLKKETLDFVMHGDSHAHEDHGHGGHGHDSHGHGGGHHDDHHDSHGHDTHGHGGHHDHHGHDTHGHDSHGHHGKSHHDSHGHNKHHGGHGSYGHSRRGPDHEYTIE